MDARFFGMSVELNDFERSLVEGEDVGIMATTSAIKDLANRAAILCKSYKLDGLADKIKQAADEVLAEVPEMSKTPHDDDDSPTKDSEYVRWLKKNRAGIGESQDDKAIAEFKKQYLKLMADFAEDLKAKKRRFPWIDAKKILEPFLTIKMSEG